MLPSSCKPLPTKHVLGDPDAPHSYLEVLGRSRSRSVSPRPCSRTAPRRVSPTTLPITTSSAKARELYVKGMEDYENLYLERCNDDWRAAVKEDPNLAVAWAWIAFNSGNPQEVSAARAKAKDLAPKTTARRAVDGCLDRQSAGRRLPRRHHRDERHARDVSPRQASSLPRGQLAHGRKRQRSGAAHDGEGARHRQELSRGSERSGLRRSAQPRIRQGI